MADHASDHQGQDISAHRETYEGFLKGSVLLALLCLNICIALVMFRFGHTWPVFLGFLGLFLGLLTLLIDLRTGATRWTLSTVFAVIFGLITAVNVS